MSEPFVSPPVAVRSNVQGTLHCSKRRDRCGVTRFVTAGRLGVRHAASEMRPTRSARPVNTYAASKSGARAFVRLYTRVYGCDGEHAAIRRLWARPAAQNVGGPRVCAALEDRDFPMTPGERGGR